MVRHTRGPAGHDPVASATRREGCELIEAAEHVFVVSGDHDAFIVKITEGVGVGPGLLRPLPGREEP
ncbi:hypothetical protein [Ornithinimicrobium pratense]|uniref:Uncharacterized protein n=1 Tax=Ornithinimicrobium pratense TaxID=2593973 RepID=A0A5J6V831_9MICO|nr:hypothetical protein [Ornithinimicrobium pratense]QFG69276.1 hypothetical protein FY030_11685 [Ornithinimicrobium pratense]